MAGSDRIRSDRIRPDRIRADKIRPDKVPSEGVHPDRVDIKSGSSSFLEATLMIDGNRYVVLTEPAGSLIMTRAYLNGQIVYTRKSELRKGASSAEPIRLQHEQALADLRKDLSRRQAETFLKEALELMRKGKHRPAYDLLTDGLEQYPDNAFLLSYHGFLMAKLRLGASQGVEECARAIKNTKNLPFGAEFYHPFLYLNLGRAYLAAGRKKEAVGAFTKGLAADPENRELKQEMKKMGLRKKPAVPFLDRSHPINKYAGKIRNALSPGKS